MLKSQMILAVALLAALTVSAQQDPVVLLLSNEKAITFCTVDGHHFKNVQPGTVILKNNTLKIPRKSSATVYSGGVFKNLPAGKHNLAQVMGEGTSMRTVGFDNTFESYLLASISLAKAANGVSSDWAHIIDPKTAGDGWGATDPKKAGDGWGSTDPKKAGDGWGVTDPKKAQDGWGATDPKKAGDGWGVTDPKKAQDGWGGSGSRIHLIMPFGIVLPANKITFSWSKPADAGTFLLQIKDASGAVVHEANTRDTFAVVDISKAPFVDGAHFAWEIQAVAEGAVLESNKLEFSISTADAKEAALFKPLRSSKIYPSANSALQGIMEAIALERQEWFYEAAQKYAELKNQHPKNNLVRMMYATFWMRFGLVPLAHSAVK